MTLSKRYNPKTAEPQLRDQWLADGTYHFDPDSEQPSFSIDTPPPTVSGHLHLGHVYSYSQTDFMARFWRMNGRNIFYPMGFDDNGLPTERLVEQWEGVTAQQIGRKAFIERCLAISEEAEQAYRDLWQRLGLSIDWRFSYRTIDERSRRISQHSFIELFEQGLAYQKQAPTIWCPECQTAIAQAELDDLEQASTFYTLAFTLPNGETLPIATTRPELLPACVAIFVHPDDGRYQHLINQYATTPIFGKQVPILADENAEPDKGSGAVMCCTFGDQMDIQWWQSHDLPLIEAIGKDGRLTHTAVPFNAQPIRDARQNMIASLDEQGKLLNQTPISHAVRVHERCDTAVEYIITTQWFFKQLDFKDELLKAGDEIEWHPSHMQMRYRQWVENLGWDWCISRQRVFGVPIPIWTCAECGAKMTPALDELPIDPTMDEPKRPCPCGSTHFIGETDVMDTWATSSMSPQIVTQWLHDEGLHQQLFPMTLRPQAHEIIRTWAFYTIYKSLRHFGTIPFKKVMISGWGLAPEGTGKISKSKGGGPIAPLAMIEQYSADAVRYWAASTSLGKDAIISEEKVQAGAKLATKLWHVSRFAGRFLGDGVMGDGATERRGDGARGDGVRGRWGEGVMGRLSLADRWVLGRTALLVRRVTALFEQFDYATAKSETETFFWRVLADNYLEMAKLRLYEGGEAAAGARFALEHSLLTTLKLFAPFMPFVTERIYQGLFDADGSIHLSQWPHVAEGWLDETAVSQGDLLVEIATAVRRFKSDHNLGLGTELSRLTINTPHDLLKTATIDLRSITRAREVVFTDVRFEGIELGEGLVVSVRE